MKVSELTNLDPTTPWLEYINTILTTNIVQVLKPVLPSLVPSNRCPVTR